MRTILFLFFIIIMGVVHAAAQLPNEENTVIIKQSTADAAAKCFTESPLKDSVIEAQKAEIKAKEAESAAKDTVIELLKEENAVLRKVKCNTLSFFFGLIKKKSCY